MTREDKKLLLKDLCARLTYGVICQTNRGIGTLISIECSSGEILAYVDFGYPQAGEFDLNENDEVKPYLRPISSMTEEEKETYYNLCYEEEREEYKFGEWAARIHYHDTIDSIDYLNSIHVDYRELIPKGLAIEVTKDNNPYNIKIKDYDTRR